MTEKRAVCLNCIDGRVQLPAIQWITGNYPVDYVDMITEPGIDGLLSDSTNSIDAITKKIDISIEKNNASIIFIVGHYDCKGNPVNDDLHKEHVSLSVNRLKEKFSHIDIIGLWVNSEWQIETI
ncbi:carbonic anhydrase [Candidatus Omnitrophota bacterium]